MRYENAACEISAVRLPDVPAATESLAGTIDRVGAVIQQLAAKLGPVLSAANSGVNADKQPTYSTPLAAALQAHDARLREYEAQAYEILSRLEV